MPELADFQKRYNLYGALSCEVVGSNIDNDFSHINWVLRIEEHFKPNFGNSSWNTKRSGRALFALTPGKVTGAIP